MPMLIREEDVAYCRRHICFFAMPPGIPTPPPLMILLIAAATIDDADTAADFRHADDAAD